MTASLSMENLILHLTTIIELYFALKLVIFATVSCVLYFQHLIMAILPSVAKQL